MEQQTQVCYVHGESSVSVNPRKTQAEIMVAARLRDPERLQAAKRDHAAAMLEQHITRIVADAPPLTPEQRDRLATLLRPASGRSA